MNTISDYRKILRRELEVRLTRNPRYSLRSFAKDLKTTAPFLSDVLKGRRGLSRASAFRIAGKLGFDATETALFCDLVESHHARSNVAKNQAKERLRLREVDLGTVKKEKGVVLNFRYLEDDKFAVLSDWYHLAILELLTVKDASSEAAFIAKRLGIKLFQAEAALNRLLEFGLLRREKTPKGEQLIPTSQHVHTPDGVSRDAWKSFHEQFMKKGVEALYTQPNEERDFRSLTIRCPKSSVPKVREKLKNFLTELDLELSGDASGEDVYQLCTQFFCLTQ